MVASAIILGEAFDVQRHDLGSQLSGTLLPLPFHFQSVALQHRPSHTPDLGSFHRAGVSFPSEQSSWVSVSSFGFCRAHSVAMGVGGHSTSSDVVSFRRGVPVQQLPQKRAPPCRFSGLSLRRRKPVRHAVGPPASAVWKARTEGAPCPFALRSVLVSRGKKLPVPPILSGRSPHLSTAAAESASHNCQRGGRILTPGTPLSSLPMSRTTHVSGRTVFWTFHTRTPSENQNTGHPSCPRPSSLLGLKIRRQLPALLSDTRDVRGVASNASETHASCVVPPSFSLHFPHTWNRPFAFYWNSTPVESHILPLPTPRSGSRRCNTSLAHAVTAWLTRATQRKTQDLMDLSVCALSVNGLSPTSTTLHEPLLGFFSEDHGIGEPDIPEGGFAPAAETPCSSVRLSEVSYAETEALGHTATSLHFHPAFAFPTRSSYAGPPPPTRFPGLSHVVSYSTMGAAPSDHTSSVGAVALESSDAPPFDTHAPPWRPSDVLHLRHHLNPIEEGRPLDGNDDATRKERDVRAGKEATTGTFVCQTRSTWPSNESAAACSSVRLSPTGPRKRLPPTSRLAHKGLIPATNDELMLLTVVVARPLFCDSLPGALASTSLPPSFDAFSPKDYQLIRMSLFEYLLRNTRVYSSMSPEDKTSLITALKSLPGSPAIAMCGDSANDCGALRAADVGIALNDACASVAAPFISRDRSIHSCVHLIREGRASLATALQMFKFVVFYSLIQYTSVVLLYLYGLNFTDNQYMFVDFAILLPLSLTLSATPPSRTLKTAASPNPDLLSKAFAGGIGLHGLVAIVYMCLLLFLLRWTPGWQPFQVTPLAGDSSGPEIAAYENTALFYLTSIQYVVVALISVPHEPWQQGILHNLGFTIWAGLLVLCYVGFLLIPRPPSIPIPTAANPSPDPFPLPPAHSLTRIQYVYVWLDRWLVLISLSLSARVLLLALLFSYCWTTYLVEHYCVARYRTYEQETLQLHRSLHRGPIPASDSRTDVYHVL